jgi:hypothetical protein
MAVNLDVTVTDVTVDELHQDLGKLKDMGWGKSKIQWHTSRSHLGNKITMTLGDAEDDG